MNNYREVKMKPLIQITSVPIMIEMRSTMASIKRKAQTVDLNISRSEGGGLKIQSSPIKLSIDTFEARNSISPTPMRSVEQSAEKGVNAAYEATARMAKEGQMFLDAKLSSGKGLDQVIANAAAPKEREFVFARIPTVPPEISWSDPDISIQYDMEKLNFDWRIAQGDFEFIPGSIEFTVTQRPEVIIEYIGGPIYVPPSADPNFEAEA